LRHGELDALFGFEAETRGRPGEWAEGPDLDGRRICRERARRPSVRPAASMPAPKPRRVSPDAARSCATTASQLSGLDCRLAAQQCMHIFIHSCGFRSGRVAAPA
jgi:hypothetical protein